MKAICQSCGWSKEVPETARGKRGRCPRCNTVFEIDGGEKGDMTTNHENDTSYASSGTAEGHLENDFADLSGPEKAAEHNGPIPQRVRQYLTEGESVYFASNPSKGTLVLGLVPSLLTVLAAILIGLGGGISGLYVTLFVIGLISALARYLSWKHRYYLITDKRTIVSHGVFNVGIRIVPNQKIQMISVDTGIIDRLLGLNTVEVSTASHGGIFGVFIGSQAGSVKLKAVQNANKVVKCYEI